MGQLIEPNVQLSESLLDSNSGQQSFCVYGRKVVYCNTSRALTRHSRWQSADNTPDPELIKSSFSYLFRTKIYK